MRELRAAGVDALNLYHRTCTPTRVAMAHSSGLLLFGWGARSGRSAARALRNGADGVFCDDTAAMVAVLSERERPAAARPQRSTMKLTFCRYSSRVRASM